MLNMGDELGRTQHGNNNAYCQAFPVRWPDELEPDGSLLAFVQRLAALRASLPELRRTTFYEAHELSWLECDGSQVSDWERPEAVLAARLSTTQGPLWLLWNGGLDPVRFTPPGAYAEVALLLRSDEDFAPTEDPREGLTLAGRSAAAVRFAP